MLITEENFREYETRNAFMAYNHIEIVSASPEKAVVRVDLLPESKNLYGFVHGGLMYSMADCVAGVAARAGGDNFVTQSSHLNFLRNVKSGTVYAAAEAVKIGKKLAIYHITVTDESGNLLADGVMDMFRTK